jgi:hypothetical protein
VVALGLLTFLLEEGQREVDALDLTEPTFLPCSVPARDQVCFEFVEARQHLRLDVQDGAS